MVDVQCGVPAVRSDSTVAAARVRYLAVIDLMKAVAKDLRKRCPARSCKNAKEPWAILCRDCWQGLPSELRTLVEETRANTREREAAAHTILRHVMRRPGDG